MFQDFFPHHIPHSFVITAFAMIGLCIGSFLNVVIYRLPQILEEQCNPEFEGKEPTMTLSKPASRCGHCGHQIRWFENIPVLSFLWLKGKCSNCGAKIGWRYPLVEIATALIFVYCAWNWKSSGSISPQAIAYAGFGAMLLCMALIDWDTTYLPDDLTLPLLWAGLICAAVGWTGVHLHTSLWGAVAGYLSLWSVYWCFKLVTGRDGMGYGDFKLLAAIGAWLGWQALVQVVLIASVSGIVLALLMKVSHKEREGKVIPFGPTLALGAAWSLVFGLVI